MISDSNDYKRAEDELHQLEGWLDRLRRDHPGPEKGFTKAGVRKMIARLHEELAVYKGSQEAGFVGR